MENKSFELKNSITSALNDFQLIEEKRQFLSKERYETNMLAKNAYKKICRNINFRHNLEAVDLLSGLDNYLSSNRYFTKAEWLIIQKNLELIQRKYDFSDLEVNQVLKLFTEFFQLQQEFDDLSKFAESKVEKVPLNEAKVILVGQGEVGKTSLIKRMMDGEFDPLEKKTDGINIKKWNISVSGKNICLHVWDFGGQEIMHATHQFFLTKRTLYLLVIAARENENQNNLEYWLKMIQSFGGASPVILVINKSEDGFIDLARRALQYKFPNIKAIIDTSCVTGLGIEDLINCIKRELSDMEFVRTNIDIRWAKIKNKLENMKNDFIDYERFKSICKKEGIDEPVEQRNLIRFLHDLGTILNFGFSDNITKLDLRLENTSVINPEWITRGVYSILNSTILRDENGVIKLDQLPGVLPEKKYPMDKQIFIIEMMKKFELCYELAEERDKFLVVAGNLSKDQPDIRQWTESHPLSFEIHYNFLPTSVISRFIVRLFQARVNNQYWRHGIVIKYQENEALVKADLVENIIYIYVTGNVQTRRDFLAVIRSEIQRINRTIAQIEAKEFIPFEGILIDYADLILLEKMGESSIVLPKLLKRVNVKEVLALVDSDNKNCRDEIITKNNPWLSGSFYVIAFLIIITALAVLARLISWYIIPLVIIGSLLTFTVIGAMQLRNDNQLKDENFYKLIIEFFKRLALLLTAKS